MTNKERVDILLKYFGTGGGQIDLSHIDFGNRIVYNNNQKAKRIYNNEQEADEIYNLIQKAKVIWNSYQEADEIDNDYQEANKIWNKYQEANEIDNSYQAIKLNYEDMSKEELIEEIKKIKGETK